LLLSAGARLLSIDISCLPAGGRGAQQQTRRTPLLRPSTRQTDGRICERLVDGAADAARREGCSVSIGADLHTAMAPTQQNNSS